MSRKTMFAAVGQAFSGWAFPVSVIGVFVILSAASMQDIVAAFRMSGLLERGFHYRLLKNALSSDPMVMALPILSTVPHAASVVDDMKSGFIKEYLPRTGRGGYIMGRIAACALSGGLVFVCGILAAYIAAALVFAPMESAAAGGAGAIEAFRELLAEGTLFFCSGAFWATMGMVAAVLTDSKYMAYASPFVIYYVLIILHERYLGSMHMLYPKEWTAPSPYWMFGEMGVVVFVTELTLIEALCFWIITNRRLL